MNPDQPGGRNGAPGVQATFPSTPLEEVVQRIQEISTLPGVALRVMEVVGDPESGTADLRAAVEADPSFCMRVLRCVNSAAYGLRNPVSDLGQAVSYLGFNQIRDLAITASVTDLFRAGDDVGTYRRPELWRHLVCVGLCARMIAARTGTEARETAFLAGLLHDVGIILFDQSRHEEFCRVIESLESWPSLTEAEHQVAGWDHTLLGHAVASRWKLPTAVLHGIRWHHEPAKCPAADRRIVHIVAVANFVCSRKGITSIGRNLVTLSDSSLEGLSIGQDDLTALAGDLDREIGYHRHLFEIQQS